MPPALLTLFEHQYRAYASLPGFPSGAAARERLLDQLERLNPPGHPPVLLLERKGLRATEQVGVVQAGDLTIEILPKLDALPGNDPAPAHSATANLLAMLSYAYDISIHPHEVAELGEQAATWFDLLTRLFAAGLYREIVAGLAHGYVSVEDTLPVLRGRWDIQRQVLRHAIDQSRFAVTYEEFSPDIPLNQVFRYVIEQLLAASQDPENQLLLSDLRDWFAPVRLLNDLAIDSLDTISFNRLNQRFQPAFAMARMFLSGSAIRLTHGGLPAYSFTFDMNLLFERFVAAFLERHRARLLPEGWSQITIRPQSAGARLFLGKSGGQNLLRLRPDLLFQAPGEIPPRLIADTKYKLLPSGRSKPALAPDDVYQMLAYTVRLGCPRGLLLYPQAGAPLRMQMDIPSANTRLAACTLNLRAPLTPPDALITELREILAFAVG